ncbi:hypothetical protein D1007_32594 [Hordeum vulgare]|nr:hypothetical protein D1007_32594 [Hordeum vulgare]
MEVVVRLLGSSLASIHVACSVGNVVGVENFIESNVASYSCELLPSVVQLEGVTLVLDSFSPVEVQAKAAATATCMEDAPGRLPVVPPISPLLEIQVGSVDGQGACLYGIFTPRAPLRTSPLLIMPRAFGSEVVIDGMAPVIQSMPELQMLSVEFSSLYINGVLEGVLAWGDVGCLDALSTFVGA